MGVTVRVRSSVPLNNFMNREKGEKLDLIGIFVIFFLIVCLTGCSYTIYKGPTEPHVPIVVPSDKE